MFATTTCELSARQLRTLGCKVKVVKPRKVAKELPPARAVPRDQGAADDAWRVVMGLWRASERSG